jgi:PAS domain S-box-containing protein
VVVAPPEAPEADLRRLAMQHSTVANLGGLALSGASLDFLLRHVADVVADVLQVEFTEVVHVEPGGRYVIVQGSGWEEGVIGSVKSGAGESQAALTLALDMPIISEDVERDGRYTAPQLLLRHRVQSSITVPITGSGAPWGVLAAYTRQRRQFTASDADFLRSVASILGQSIERARAEIELRIRATQQSAIAELGRLAFCSVNQQTIDRACELVQNGLGVELAYVLQCQGSNTLSVRAGSPSIRATDCCIPFSEQSQSALAVMTGLPVVVRDYANDGRFGETRDFGLEIRSGISVPIGDPSTTSCGVLAAYSRIPRAFTEADVHFMQSLANTLSEAIAREDATRALVDSEARYRSVIEGASEIIFELGLDGSMRALNRSFETIIGGSREEWKGRKFYEVIVPEERERISNLFRSGIESARPFSWETTVLRIDGKRIVLAADLTPKVVGGSVTVHGFARDITEERRAALERQALTRQLELLLESTPGGIFAVDLERRCTLLNRAAARMLGRTADELAGMRIDEPVGAGETVWAPAATRSAIDEVIAGGIARTLIEDVFVRPDGTPLPVELSVAPIVDGIGTIGAVVTFDDVTERRMLEAKLEQANRLSSLGRLAATVAHEFNNVLMGISPFVEVLQRTNNPEKVAMSLDHIGKSVKRGRRITQDILRFTQPARPVLSDVNVPTWLRTLEVEASSILTKPYELEVRSEPLNIHGDAGQLHQIFLNLILNARDAMASGGTIRVTVRRDAADARFAFGVVDDPSKYAHFIVSDTGCGMSESTLRHALEPLFTTKKNGTGLGLAVTQQVVQHHAGEIFIESAVDKGTSFHVFLPLSR